MSLTELSPAERHRRIAAGFTARVEGTGNWDAQAPVAGWTARAVVQHLVGWLPGFLSSGAGVTLPASQHTDPIRAWHGHTAVVQELLDDPGTATRMFHNPHIGEIPLDRAIDQFYTADVFMHTWDLARATGQDERLDPQLCESLLSGMQPMDAMMRASGQFGPAVPIPADADPQTRLIGFIGRNPF